MVPSRCALPSPFVLSFFCLFLCSLPPPLPLSLSHPGVCFSIPPPNLYAFACVHVYTSISRYHFYEHVSEDAVRTNLLAIAPPVHKRNENDAKIVATATATTSSAKTALGTVIGTPGSGSSGSGSEQEEEEEELLRLAMPLALVQVRVVAARMQPFPFVLCGEKTRGEGGGEGQRENGFEPIHISYLKSCLINHHPVACFLILVRYSWRRLLVMAVMDVPLEITSSCDCT